MVQTSSVSISLRVFRRSGDPLDRPICRHRRPILGFSESDLFCSPAPTARPPSQRGGVVADGDLSHFSQFQTFISLSARSRTIRETFDLGVGVSNERGHPEGPEALSAGCSPSEPEVIAEVPLATPTMQAVQDSWMGLVTRRPVGVWGFVIVEIWWEASRGQLVILLRIWRKVGKSLEDSV